MKSILFATISLFVAFAAGQTAFAGEPAPKTDAPALTPPVIPPVASDPLTPRQEVALRAAERLDHLDDAVALLRIRCDEKPACQVLAPAFTKLKGLRADVLTALADLRDPAVGFNAAEHAVVLALSQLDLAIQILARNVEETSGPSAPLVSRE